MKRAQPEKISLEMPAPMSFALSRAHASHEVVADRAEPVLKWAGGKRWLAPLLGPLIKRQLHQNPDARYFEPFLGGGAVALWLGATRMVVADVELPLIETYVAIRRDWSAVHAQLQTLINGGTDRDTFLKVRASSPLTATTRAARLIYLNRLCFNGLYRTNSHGQFNVPYGDYVTPVFPSPVMLRRVSDALAHATIRAADFESILADTGPADVVYADPPYYSAASGFRSYHQHPFLRSDHERLAQALCRAHKRGVTVFATNADDPYIHDIYSWAHLFATSERRAINCVATRRTGAACVLISSTALTDPFCPLQNTCGTPRVYQQTQLTLLR